jgi:hypothetical protein
MGLGRAEQETVIRWDEDAQQVSVWSASPKTWRKMARLGLEPYRTTTTGGEPTGKFWRLGVTEFRWGLKSKRKGNTAAFRRRPE